ncbi:uncharacterized protein STEHIDRAFT_162754 [Stereum hirsutum FP-91666 SS1]|uniref:Uncharacterized protein n=1 Tax=Stereum hirsutum (strain FP-91666) TaxID=721885 RepID=R7RYC7_STEHR|nr:uncharacterized protein STEHIDRAFT_162754 [Stereum hirsutum FP-91666 SS1]EIM80334.1 hypothetical protein STEHIDRAFT_162754 [Stereum hirsutum FP-91666 SS1]
MTASGFYTSLPKDDNYRRGSTQTQPSKCCGLEAALSTRILRWAVILLIATSIFDAMVFAYIAIHVLTDLPSLNDPRTENTFRSTYINFDKIYMGTNVSTPKHRPIINLPRTSIQVSSSEPYKVFSPSNLSWPEAHGFVPISDQRFFVDETVGYL